MSKPFRNLLKKVRIFFDTRLNGEKFLNTEFYDEHGNLLVVQEIRLKRGREITKFK